MIQEITCDAAIMGGGIAGMIAATRAALHGKRVVVLEKLPEERYVCNSRLTQGVIHCCMADPLTPPDHLEARILEATAGRARADLARAVAEDGLRAVRFLQSVGVRFLKGPFSYQSFVLSPPSVTSLGRSWEGRGGDVMLRQLESVLRAHGGTLMRGHRATELIAESGRITGVSGMTAEGRPFSIRSDAVIIADGGAQASDEVMRQWGWPNPEQVFQRNAGTGKGDGLRMAQSVGAAITGMDAFYGHVLSRDAFHNSRLALYPFLDFVLSSSIVVDGNAQRFTDEGLGGIAAANAIARSADSSDKIVIADERIWKERGSFRLMSPNPVLSTSGGRFYTADSLQALALKAGLDPSALEATVVRYNAAIRAGTTESLSPPRTHGAGDPWLIEEPPFYAFPVCAGITYTMGGISINADGQVLSRAGEPIAGLYAAGCATGGLEGGSPTGGYVGGLVKSIVTGLRTAEHVIGAKFQC